MVAFQKILNEYALKLQNTESRQKELLKPRVPHHVTLYTCGPTVYNFAHIGNFRTYVFEDLLRRTIKFFGFKITHVMNLTDVDDKTIRGAIQAGTTLDEYTSIYKKAFFEDIKTLNIEPAEHYPAATDYIPEMIRIVQTLLDKGTAYYGKDGSVYFSIKEFARYGCLSHLKLDELKSGASERVAADEYDKDHVADFVLWKKYDEERDGGIYWESPFGRGRPGWHIECSAMAMKILGETIDIHVGGVDNMFPHHENEIAQSEACTGHQFVNLWLHSEHLIVDNKKMSKSLGNFFTLRDLLQKGFSGIQVRYLLLQTHYRTQLNFTFEGLESAKSSLDRVNTFIRRLNEIQSTGQGIDIETILEKYLRQFAEALSDDLNISVALAAVFDLLREVNSLADNRQIHKKEAEKVLHLLKQFNQVLGIFSFENVQKPIPREIVEAAQGRDQARKMKDWALADQLREYITNNGYTVEDTPHGPRLIKH